MQKSLKHKSQKAFVTSSPVLAINTENQMELETGLFRVVGQVLPGFDKVEVHHLEGPLPTGFLQRAVSKGKGCYTFFLMVKPVGSRYPYLFIKIQ